VHSKCGISNKARYRDFGNHRSTGLPYFDLYFFKLTPEEFLKYLYFLL